MKKINKRIVLRKSLGLLLAALLAFASLTGCSTTGKDAGTDKNVTGVAAGDKSNNSSNSSSDAGKEKIINIAVSSDPSYASDALGDSLLRNKTSVAALYIVTCDVYTT